MHHPDQPLGFRVPLGDDIERARSDVKATYYRFQPTNSTSSSESSISRPPVLPPKPNQRFRRLSSSETLRRSREYNAKFKSILQWTPLLERLPELGFWVRFILEGDFWVSPIEEGVKYRKFLGQIERGFGPYKFHYILNRRKLSWKRINPDRIVQNGDQFISLREHPGNRAGLESKFPKFRNNEFKTLRYAWEGEMLEDELEEGLYHNVVQVAGAQEVIWQGVMTPRKLLGIMLDNETPMDYWHRAIVEVRDDHILFPPYQLDEEIQDKANVMLVKTFMTNRFVDIPFFRAKMVYVLVTQDPLKVHSISLPFGKDCISCGDILARCGYSEAWHLTLTHDQTRYFPFLEPETTLLAGSFVYLIAPAVPIEKTVVPHEPNLMERLSGPAQKLLLTIGLFILPDLLIYMVDDEPPVDMMTGEFLISLTEEF